MLAYSFFEKAGGHWPLQTGIAFFIHIYIGEQHHGLGGEILQRAAPSAEDTRGISNDLGAAAATAAFAELHRKAVVFLSLIYTSRVVSGCCQGSRSLYH